MIYICRKSLDMTGTMCKEVSQAAAGISISLDKIVSALQEENSSPAVDVIVCSVGHRSMVKEKAAVIRDLWAAGIKSSLVDNQQVPYLFNYVIYLFTPIVDATA